MKVRIGNDIRLNLTLKGPRSFDQTNIKELKCFLINTSVLDYNPLAVACEKRFPGHCCGGCSSRCCGNCHEHCCDLHHPISPIHMHTCGVPGYFVNPFKCHCHCGHLKYPYTPVNPAFGEAPLRPNYGHCCGCCEHGCHNHDHDNFCRYGHCDHRSRCFDPCCWDSMHYCPCHFRPGYCDFIAPHLDENFRYLADSKVLSGKNRIQTYFPARDQFMCGDYKLVVVVVVYESGWGRCDLHTYTIDYGTVVTLVDDDSAAQGSITIDVDKDEMEGSDITNLMPTSNDIYIFSGSTIRPNEHDYYNNLYEIGVTLFNGNYMTYNPNNWEGFEDLVFSIDDESVATINNKGVITASNTMQDKTTIVEVRTNNDSTTFNLHVIGSGKNYIGFSDNNSWQLVKNEIDDQTTSLVEVNDVFGTHSVTLTGENKYLWIVSTQPIADGNSANVLQVKTSLFDVPLTVDGQHNGLYYYHCPNSLTAESNGQSGDGVSIDFDITIEEK